MISVKKINDVVVRPPKTLMKGYGLPVKGAEMFEEPFCNIFLSARKKSGKTTVIYNILKKCICRDTKIFFFVSTIYKDATYKAIMDMLEANNIDFTCYTSLKEDGVDHLQQLVDCLKLKAEEDFKKKDEEPQTPLCKALFPNEDDEEDKPKRKPTYIFPEYVVILDDLSDEMKSQSLVTLLKNHRHWKMKILLSSQYYKDLLPSSRNQIDYFLLFQNTTEDKLEVIYKDADLTITEEQFKKIYHWATKEKYNFLYIDKANSTFRKNFNIEIKT